MQRVVGEKWDWICIWLLFLSYAMDKDTHYTGWLCVNIFTFSSRNQVDLLWHNSTGHSRKAFCCFAIAWTGYWVPKKKMKTESKMTNALLWRDSSLFDQRFIPPWILGLKTGSWRPQNFITEKLYKIWSPIFGNEGEKWKGWHWYFWK